MAKLGKAFPTWGPPVIGTVTLHSKQPAPHMIPTPPLKHMATGLGEVQSTMQPGYPASPCMSLRIEVSRT